MYPVLYVRRNLVGLPTSIDAGDPTAVVPSPPQGKLPSAEKNRIASALSRCVFTSRLPRRTMIQLPSNPRPYPKDAFCKSAEGTRSLFTTPMRKTPCAKSAPKALIYFSIFCTRVVHQLSENVGGTCEEILHKSLGSKARHFWRRHGEKMGPLMPN